MRKMWRIGLVMLVLLSGCSPLYFAQQRVQPRLMYERLIAVLPMAGAGTYEDPRRPLFAPVTSRAGGRLSRRGIVGFSYLVSDDGQWALAEFVAVQRSVFRPILESLGPSARVFYRGVSRREDIEQEFRRFKADFNLDQLGVAVR